MASTELDLDDPVVSAALLNCRLAMRTLMGEEAFFASPYWWDTPEVTLDGDAVVFRFEGGRRLNWFFSTEQVLETVEAPGPTLACQAVSATGRHLHFWLHHLGSEAAN